MPHFAAGTKKGCLRATGRADGREGGREIRLEFVARQNRIMVVCRAARARLPESDRGALDADRHNESGRSTTQADSAEIRANGAHLARHRHRVEAPRVVEAMSLRRHSFFIAMSCVLGLGVTACAVDPLDGDDEHEDEPVVESEEQLKSGVSCSVRTVTGYRTGSPYSLKVVTVGGKPTAIATAHAFSKWQAAADKAGVSLSINSGFRTMDQQKYLYDCYQTKRCNNGTLAARPGYSNHQNGEALDLATSSWSWVQRTAGQFGFRATVPGERWHYEYRGADPGGICSGGGATAGGDEPATAVGDDEPEPNEPAGGACNSATLGKTMPEGSCVQSSSTELWYQCEAGKWYRGVSNGAGPYGKCTTMVGL